MAAPPGAGVIAYGQVMSCEVREDRSIILTIQDPRHDEPVLVRVLPIELQTILAAKPPAPRRRRGSPNRTPAS